MLRPILTVLGATVLLGLVYPLALMGAAQVIPQREVVFAERTHLGDPRYFQPRPSQTGYRPDATAFANRGPNSSTAASFYRDQAEAYRALNGAEPPIDAVTTSASGVDPLISRANAEIQARRIARVRGIPVERIHLDGDAVNTTELNRELDR